MYRRTTKDGWLISGGIKWVIQVILAIRQVTQHNIFGHIEHQVVIIGIEQKKKKKKNS